MRIDKFLWYVRVYKTRSIASDEIKKNRVSIGGQICKSSKEISLGDVISVKKNTIEFRFKVLQIPKSRLGAKLVSQYIEDKTEAKQYELLKQRKEVQNYYRLKGEGRPTKKDRRELSDFLQTEPSSQSDENSTSTDWDLFFMDLEQGDEE